MLFHGTGRETAGEGGGKGFEFTSAKHFRSVRSFLDASRADYAKNDLSQLGSWNLDV
jgi:hypothetical protein